MAVRLSQASARLILLWIICLPAWAGTDGKLPLAADFRLDAAESRRVGVPILIFFSLKGCPYCEVIRASHLLPMRDEAKRRVIIRQINLQDSAPLKDFAGRATTHREYSQSQKVTFAPLVMLVDDEGRALAEPLKGAMLPDFYGAHLDDAISQAAKSIQQKPRK